MSFSGTQQLRQRDPLDDVSILVFHRIWNRIASARRELERGRRVVDRMNPIVPVIVGPRREGKLCAPYEIAVEVTRLRPRCRVRPRGERQTGCEDDHQRQQRNSGRTAANWHQLLLDLITLPLPATWRAVRPRPSELIGLIEPGIALAAPSTASRNSPSVSGPRMKGI